MARSFGFTVLLCSVLASACISLQTGPFDTVSYPADGESPGARDLVVFLRGRGGDHRSFAAQGWIETLRRARPETDAVAPNTHFGYYRDRSLVPQLETDILQPAAARGAEDVWLVGVSMGGLGSLFTLRDSSAEIAGAVLLAPFLGSQELHAEIAAAGGLAAWEPGLIAEEDWERGLWAWLKEVASHPDEYPPLILGYGDRDKFVSAQRLLGAALPPEHVLEIPGKHRDAVFKRLWDLVLERGLLDVPEDR